VRNHAQPPDGAGPDAERLASASPARPGRFPSTAWSAVTSALGEDPRLAAAALSRLCQIHRASIVRWFEHAQFQPADAEDATQEFLHQIFGGARLESYAPREHRFRSWLLTCLRHFAADWQRGLTVVRRGGAVGHEDVAHVDPPAPNWSGTGSDAIASRWPGARRSWPAS